MPIARIARHDWNSVIRLPVAVLYQTVLAFCKLPVLLAGTYRHYTRTNPVFCIDVLPYAGAIPPSRFSALMSFTIVRRKPCRGLLEHKRLTSANDGRTGTRPLPSNTSNTRREASKGVLSKLYTLPIPRYLPVHDANNQCIPYAKRTLGGFCETTIGASIGYLRWPSSSGRDLESSKMLAADRNPARLQLRSRRLHLGACLCREYFEVSVLTLSRLKAFSGAFPKDVAANDKAS